MLALGATIRTNKREIAADDFFKGLFTTRLAEDELITAISFPKPEKAAYVKFHNPASRYAMVGVFVAKTGGGIRVAVTGAGRTARSAGPRPSRRWPATSPPRRWTGCQVDPGGMNGDIHGSAEYRAHLVKVMAKRAVQAAG